MLLISDRPPRVAPEYRDALAVADRFAIGAADRNIQIFRSLRLLEANVAAALREIEAASSHAGAGSAMEPAARVILLPVTLVDKPDTSPGNQRFPRSVQAERRARQMIENAVSVEMKRPGGVSLGIAAGACGADILRGGWSATVSYVIACHLEFSKTPSPCHSGLLESRITTCGRGAICG